MRKMASIQRITSIEAHPNADRLEIARVMGWTVIVGKGEFKAGDLAIYFEVDSFLPETNPRFESFQARGQREFFVDGESIRGHVLKTAKLRGVVSQGLLMPMSSFEDDIYHHEVAIGEVSATDPAWAPHVGLEVTEAVGVFKWEPPLPTNGEIIGTFDTRFAPKTDAPRAQNLSEHWELIKSLDWVPTVKVDGSSTTIVNDDGAIRVFGRNWELSSETAGMVLAERQGLLEGLQPGMAIQAELVGPGVQANRLRLNEQRLIVFSMWRDGVKLPRDEWTASALESATPVLGPEWAPQGTLDEMIEKVNTLRGSITRDVLDEGIVWHPVNPALVPDELSQVLDRNCNFKLVSNTWLLKSKD